MPIVSKVVKLITKGIVFVLLIAGFILFSPETVFAQTVLFQDNFDDGDAEGWIITRNPCQSNWLVENGKYGIRVFMECVTETIPSSLLIPQDIHYSFEVDMNLSGTIDADRNFVFKYRDPLNWYGIHTVGQDIYFQKVVNGIAYQLPGWHFNYPFLDNDTYRFKVEVKGDEYNIYINEILVSSFNDTSPTFANYSAGLQASAGGIPTSVVWFDNFIVKKIEPTLPSLDVIDWKQYSIPWEDDIYDHAEVWSSEPTIRRFGCSVTSTAMVLKYFKHNTTPGALNEWLKENKGYMRNGSIIWSAISRYSSEHAAGDSSKLEFTIHPPSKDFLIDSLESDLPIILRLPIPLHFLVIKGQTGNDFLVNDPNSEVNNVLSKAAGIHGEPNQGYLFAPTNSDLSYMVFAVNPNITIELFDTSGNALDSLITIEEAPADGVSLQNLNSEPLKVLWLPKPIVGDYILKLSGIGSYQLDSYLYNKEGVVSDSSFQGVLNGDNYNDFSVVISDENPPLIQPIITFDDLVADLDAAYDQKLINNYGIYKSTRTQLIAAKRHQITGRIRLSKLLLQVVYMRIRVSTPKFIDLNTSSVFLANVRRLLLSLP